jgi:hypothetical protein
MRRGLKDIAATGLTAVSVLVFWRLTKGGTFGWSAIAAGGLQS